MRKNKYHHPLGLGYIPKHEEIDNSCEQPQEEIQNEIARLSLDSASIEYLKREVARLSLENEFLQAQIKLIIERNKKFVLRSMAISGRKLDLRQMTIGEREEDKLNGYELGFIKAVESAQARKRRKNQLEDDIKQKEKAIVKDCWYGWQKAPKQYKNKTKFAQAMLDKFRPDNPDDEYKHLNSIAVITEWCRDWEYEKSQSAS